MQELPQKGAKNLSEIEALQAPRGAQEMCGGRTEIFVFFMAKGEGERTTYWQPVTPSQHNKVR